MTLLSCRHCNDDMCLLPVHQERRMPHRRGGLTFTHTHHSVSMCVQKEIDMEEDAEQEASLQGMLTFVLVYAAILAVIVGVTC